MGGPAHNPEKPHTLHSASLPYTGCSLACKAAFAFAHGTLLVYAGPALPVQIMLSIGFNCGGRDTGLAQASSAMRGSILLKTEVSQRG